MKEQRIIEILSPAITGLGLEVLGVEYAPHASNSLVRVYIEAPGRAVSVDDCERASREIASVLDVEDPIQGRYTLEVSSPGLDRLLFTSAQVARHVGETAKFTLNLPQDGRRRVQGRIEGVDGERIELDVEGEPITLDFGNVAKARLVPDFATILPGTGNKPGRKSTGKAKGAGVPGSRSKRRNDAATDPSRGPVRAASGAQASSAASAGIQQPEHSKARGARPAGAGVFRDE